MENVVDEIKARLDIVDVVSEYIQLKQAGTNFRAKCPFHQEKTPSFFVSAEKQIWHCFGCEKGSDIFGFIQEIEGVEFPEALRILANKAGVEIKKQDRRLFSQKTKLLDICQLSSKFYHKLLLESPLAEKARKYLKQRGLDKKSIKDFEIGFAPDRWDELLKFLLKRGYKRMDIELAGLIIPKGSKHYDRFRNRIIFPINDIYSQTIGFTSRIMPGSDNENKMAKYINTPETPVYNKSRVLYGLDKAKINIKSKDKVILVEGNMDVITAHQFGTKNVVCTSGTALTKEQVKILQRYTENIMLGFDVDTAGQTATQRSIDLLLHNALNISVIVFEKGKDPDECIRKYPNVWKKAIKNPLPIMEYYFSLAFENKDLDNIEHKKQITKFLLPIIVKLGDPVEQGLWLKKISNKLDVSEVFLFDALKKIKLPKRELGENQEKKQEVSQLQQAQDRFLGLILLHPDIGQEFLDRLIIDMFVNTSGQNLVRSIKKCYNKANNIDFKIVKKTIKDKELSNYLDFLSFLINKDFKDYSEKSIKRELTRLFYILKKHYLVGKIKKLTEELRSAERRKNKDSIDKLSNKIANFTKQLAD